jgi:hypothetical protein
MGYRYAAKPTIFDVYDSEEAMCKIFWAQVKELQMYGRIPQYCIFRNGANQRAGGLHGKIAGKKEKLIGIEPGVLDYTVLGIGYLEAKRYYVDRDTGKIKRTYMEPEQRDFAEKAKARGLLVDEFLTPSQGIDILLSWLKLPHTLTQGDANAIGLINPVHDGVEIVNKPLTEGV